MPVGASSGVGSRRRVADTPLRKVETGRGFFMPRAPLRNMPPVPERPQVACPAHTKAPDVPGFCCAVAFSFLSLFLLSMALVFECASYSMYRPSVMLGVCS
jgi:hypothetical protein